MSDLAAVPADHRDGREPDLILVLREVCDERVPPVAREEPVALDHTRDVVRLAQRARLEVAVVRLRDGEGLVEGPLHLRLEPSFDRAADEVRRDDEDHDGRCHGEDEEREDELRLEFRAEHLVAALERELHEVAEQEDEQEQEDDEVEVQEGDDRHVGRHRDLGRAHAEVERARHPEEQEEPRDDHEVALALVLLAEKWHQAGSRARKPITARTL